MSIGLPVYNGENFLAETLQSLRAQTFEDLEIDAEGEVLGDRVRHDDLLEDAVHRRFRAAISSPHPSIVVFGVMRLATMRSTGQQGNYFGADRSWLPSSPFAGLSPRSQSRCFSAGTTRKGTCGWPISATRVGPT